MNEAMRVRVSGPLAGDAAELIGYMSDRGYGDKSIVEHVRRLAHVSRWLERERLTVEAVDEQLIGRLVAALHKAGKGKIETVPGKSWFTFLRLYGPLDPWFDKTWRPGEIEPWTAG